MNKSTLMILALAAFSCPAAAQEVKLGQRGLSQILVWKDRQAYKDGIALIRAGYLEKDQSLIMEHLACVLPSGASAVVMSRDWGLVNIMVTTGEQKGCRGLVPMEDVP